MSGVIRLPEVLCVHLKRFRHELMFSAKVAARVSFPINDLNMAPYCHKGDCGYGLRAMHIYSSLSHVILSLYSVSILSPSFYSYQRQRLILLSLSLARSYYYTTNHLLSSLSVSLHYILYPPYHILPYTVNVTRLSSECTSSVSRYSLCAVICHAGTAGGGHYTCVARVDDRWYSFDDAAVTPLTTHHLASCEAYVLFYR